ncbi:MAG: hypothetical protein AAF443_03015 [Chlamydiota bacterium]
MEDLSKYEDDFFVFLETGFIAINQADEDSAVKLFKICEMMKPNNSLIKTGLGYLHLHKLELKAAAECFREVLQAHPQDEMAQTFLGITLALTPTQTTEGEKLLEKSATKSSDSQIKKVANTSLDFVERFVKRAPGPAEIKRK